MHTPWRNLTDNTPKTVSKLYWLIGINVIFLAFKIAPLVEKQDSRTV